MVYRVTLQHSEIQQACLELNRGRAVAIVATRGDSLKETVQVVTATAPCLTLEGPTGAVAALATFQMLLKKSGVPLANAFTVVGRCGGSTHTWPVNDLQPAQHAACLLESLGSLLTSVLQRCQYFALLSTQ